jgi:hypothetical protein
MCFLFTILPHHQSEVWKTRSLNPNASNVRYQEVCALLGCTKTLGSPSQPYLIQSSTFLLPT